MFNRILCTLSHAQLRLVFDEYKAISGGKSIEQTIKSEMSGDLKDGMLAIVQCSQSKIDFYATRLYKAMKVGVGTGELRENIISLFTFLAHDSCHCIPGPWDGRCNFDSNHRL